MTYFPPTHFLAIRGFAVLVFIYAHNRLNCVYERGCPSLFAITYSDVADFFASIRASNNRGGIGMLLLAAFVLSSSKITGLLFFVCHALRTVRYGDFTSKYTESHFSASISSLRRPAYRPNITNRYGGRSLTAFSSFSTCSSVSGTRSF